MSTRPPPLASTILDAIGNTPLVELHRAVGARGLGGRILVKLHAQVAIRVLGCRHKRYWKRGRPF